MDKIFEVLKENPWWVVGAVIIGVFLLRSPPAPARGGSDGSVALASQEIASSTNVALAGIQVDRESVAASQNIAAIQANRDISLGAQQFAIADKSLKAQTTMAGYEQTNILNQVTAGLTSNLFTTLAGAKLAEKDLNNQVLGMRINQHLTERDQDLARDIRMEELAKGDIADSRAGHVAMTSLLNEFNTTLANLNFQREIVPQQLQQEYNIVDRQMSNLENMYWRQKQIAKQQGMFDMFNGLISGGFSLASAGLGR